MARKEIRLYLGEHRQWEQGVARYAVGGMIPLLVEDTQVGEARIVAAEVVEDGAALRLTVDGPGTLLENMTVSIEALDEPETGEAS